MNKQICKMVALSLLLIFTVAQPASAKDALKLKWTDLVKKTAPLKHPLDFLSPEQREEFENIEYWRSLRDDPGSNKSSKEYSEAKTASARSRKKLARQGIDTKALYKKYDDWQIEIDRRSRLTVSKYNNKQVSLAGYLLPLDFAKSGVREFLLVPYVGACIHTPPPPTNQVAFVRLKKPYKVKALFDPVWVTGQIKPQLISKNLSFVDGSDMVEAGYLLSGMKITKYTPPE